MEIKANANGNSRQTNHFSTYYSYSANNIGDDLGVYSSVAGIFKASQSLG